MCWLRYGEFLNATVTHQSDLNLNTLLEGAVTDVVGLLLQFNPTDLKWLRRSITPDEFVVWDGPHIISAGKESEGYVQFESELVPVEVLDKALDNVSRYTSVLKGDSDGEEVSDKVITPFSQTPLTGVDIDKNARDAMIEFMTERKRRVSIAVLTKFLSLKGYAHMTREFFNAHLDVCGDYAYVRMATLHT